MAFSWRVAAMASWWVLEAWPRAPGFAVCPAVGMATGLAVGSGVKRDDQSVEGVLVHRHAVDAAPSPRKSKKKDAENKPDPRRVAAVVDLIP